MLIKNDVRANDKKCLIWRCPQKIVNWLQSWYYMKTFKIALEYLYGNTSQFVHKSRTGTCTILIRWSYLFQPTFIQTSFLDVVIRYRHSYLETSSPCIGRYIEHNAMTLMTMVNGDGGGGVGGDDVYAININNFSEGNF